MESLLGRIANGDSRAVEECLETYGGLVWSIARRYCPPSAEAEDAVQEVFLQIWQKASQYDPRLSSEKTFIAMIARRRMIDRLRKGGNRPRPLSLDDASTGDPVDRADRRIESGTDASLAAKALRALPPAQRRALLLSVCYGYTHVEIAEATGTPLGTIKSYITRGLKMVRDNLRLPRVEAREAASE